MNKKELEEWLIIEGNVDVQVPNEIFEDFNNARFNNYNHKCFAYSYYYLISYLYRNTVYGRGNPEQYSLQNIANVFVANNTKISYITKKKGILDNLGYTETTTDYPIAFYMEKGVLQFSLIKELRQQLSTQTVSHSPRFSIKEPLKALKRFENEDFTGTFYDFQNTHSIGIERFTKIITDSQLGHVGFFVYGYLKMMNDKFPMGYQISNQKLAEVVGCSERTLSKYTKRLEEVGLIKSERKLLGYKLLEKIYNIQPEG